LRRFGDLHCGKHLGLLLVDGGDAAHRRRLVDRDAVMLDAAQLCQRPEFDTLTPAEATFERPFRGKSTYFRQLPLTEGLDR
jgi:hypothetical protein